jgi:hypothetical protein
VTGFGFVTFQASGWLSEEKLSPLIRAAPGLLLGKLSPSGPNAGKGAGRAGQALYTALSDSLLRSDGAGDPAALQRRASAVLQPLTDIIDGAVSGGTPAEVIEQVTPVLAAVIGRLKTASKNVRATVFQVGYQPPAILSSFPSHFLFSDTTHE